MKKAFFTLLLLAALMVGITGSASAAKPAQFTIKIHNLTSETVEFNYTDTAGNVSFASFPVGISSLTLTEGQYSYWAVFSCGHTAGSFNLVQQRQSIWLNCETGSTVDLVKPSAGALLGLPQSCAEGKLAYHVYDWDAEIDSASYWKSYGFFCLDTTPDEGESYEANIWLNGETLWYEYHGSGLGGDNCIGWTNPEPIGGFYWTDDPASGVYCP